MSSFKKLYNIVTGTPPSSPKQRPDNSLDNDMSRKAGSTGGKDWNIVQKVILNEEPRLLRARRVEDACEIPCVRLDGHLELLSETGWKKEAPLTFASSTNLEIPIPPSLLQSVYLLK